MSDDLSMRDVRLAKLARMRELGFDPYAVEKFEVSHSARGLLEDFVEGMPVSFAGRVVSYRLMGKAGFAHLSDGDARIQAYFRKDDLDEIGWALYGLLDLGDHVGVTGRLFTTKTGEKSIHVDVVCPLSKALHAIPLGKEKDGQVFSGLADVDQRYRHRHLDLLTNADARRSLIDRMKIVRAVRHYFDGEGYLEVETPILQIEAGGAAARPFATHYNAYETDVKLRISLELYLKRLICGDLPRVYEIGRVFRNEGVSQRHNPEFTLLEFYESYADLETMMMRVEECFRAVAFSVFGGPYVFPKEYAAFLPTGRILGAHNFFRATSPNVAAFQLFNDATIPSILDSTPLTSGDVHQSRGAKILIVDGTPSRFEDVNGQIWLRVTTPVDVEIDGDSMTLLEGDWHFFSTQGIEDRPVLDFSKPWRRVSLLEEIERHTGLTRADLSSLDRAKAALGAREIVNPANGKRIDAAGENNLGGLIEKLLEVFVEPTLQEPTFVVGYPIETSPLAKKDPNDPKMTRRFEGYILGKEVCNAFSEINDPIDQRERFEQQLGERAKGDDEAHPMDEEFLYALECGMPPTGGCGIGIDRMAMMLTGSDHLREVLLFPFMRPTAAQAAD